MKIVKLEPENKIRVSELIPGDVFRFPNNSDYWLIIKYDHMSKFAANLLDGRCTPIRSHDEVVKVDGEFVVKSEGRRSFVVKSEGRASNI